MFELFLVIVVIVREEAIYPMIKTASQLGMGTGDYVFIVLFRPARFQYVSMHFKPCKIMYSTLTN